MPFTLEDAHTNSLQLLGSASDFIERILVLTQNAPIFSSFTPDEIALIARGMPVYCVERDQAFIYEGSRGDFLVFLLYGMVDIIKFYGTTKQKLISTAGPGKTLGEMSMLDGEPRFATCVAAESTTFCILGRDFLDRILKDYPNLGARILLQITFLLNQRLRRITEALLQQEGT